MADGNLPYLDFSLEYPPLAAAVFWLAGVLPGAYGTTFSFLMMIALVLTVVPVTLTARALGLSAARQVAAGGITAFIPVLLGGLVGTRFDLVLAALIAWILWAVVTDRMTTAWVLLALAVLVKLIPLAFIPVLVMVHVRRHGGSDTLKSAFTGLAVLVVVALPLALIAPSGLWDSVSYHLDRPLQLESTGAAYLMAMRLLAGIPLAVDTSFGSQGLQGEAPDLMALISTIVLVVLVLAIALTVQRLLVTQPPSADSAIFVAGIAATSVALLVAGKVLSPQFLVWIVPAAVLVRGRFGWPSAVVVALSLPGGVVMTLAGGLLFGPWVGTGLTVVGATIGACALFLAARSALAPLVAGRASTGPDGRTRWKNLPIFIWRRSFCFSGEGRWLLLDVGSITNLLRLRGLRGWRLTALPLP